MRLLILSWRDLSHPRAGGSEVYVEEVARAWALSGHEVTIFCAAVDGQPPSQERDGYRIVRAGSRLSVYRKARRYYRRHAAGRIDAVLDVVNTRPFLTPTYVREPIVALIHQVAREVWRYEAPPALAQLGRYVFEPRWLARYRATPVVTVSPSSSASLRSYGLRDVTVVPEGVTARPRPTVERERRPTLLFVGRLSANKRPGDVIAAYRLVRQHVPDAQLWVVGEGPLAERLARAAPPGTTFFGRVPADERDRLMASAHLLLATSVREGWGLTVSEAALLGTRAVGYDVPGLSDSVPAAGGDLVAPTPGALAAGVLAALPGALGQQPFAVGSAGVTSWAEVARSVLAAVELAAGGSGPRRPGAGVAP